MTPIVATANAASTTITILVRGRDIETYLDIRQQVTALSRAARNANSLNGE
jgi:hypothetical protein